MPPRYQARPTDLLTRVRNEMDALGRPGMAGLHRIGGNRGGRGQGQQSAVSDGSQTPADEDATGSDVLLVASVEADAVATGGDYITFGAPMESRGFDGVATPSGGAWVHPVTGTYELACVVDTDDLVGTVSVELELAGETADQWLIVTGSAAGRGLGVISYFTEAGQVGKVKVTHADGADVAFDAVMWLSITDRGDVETVVCLELAFSDAFSSGAARDGWTDAVGSIWLNGGPDGSHAWDASTLGDELVYTADAADQGTRWVVRFDYYTETYPSGTSDHVLMGTSGSETQVKTEIGTSGQVLLYANGLRDTSAAGVVQLATWQTWEIDATLDAAGEGSIKLTIDGVVIYEQTGITTAAGPFLNAQFTNAGGTGAEGYDNIEIFVDRCVG